MNANVEAALTSWPEVEAAQSCAIRSLRGTVLEIGAGRGANFEVLDPSVDWIGLEPSRRRRGPLAANARSHGHHREPLDGAAEAIPLPDASVDAVLATRVLCSVTDQGRVLAEIARVLVPGGRVVLGEHVAAPEGTGTRAVLRMARPFTTVLDHGCDPVRDTEAAVRASQLRIDEVARFRVPAIGKLAIPYVVIEASRPN